MLVLTRKIGQKLMIDEQVEISVLEVRGNQIRLGIRAPKHVSIRREEIEPKPAKSSIAKPVVKSAAKPAMAPLAEITCFLSDLPEFEALEVVEVG